MPRVFRRWLAHAPWSLRAWRDTFFVLAAVPLQFAPLFVLAASWLSLAYQQKPLWHFALAALITAAVMLVAAPALTALQRRRFRTVLGVQIPPAPAIARPLSFRGLLERSRSAAYWRQIRYHVLAGPAIGVGGLAALAAWVAGLALATVDAWNWLLPPSGPLHGDPQKELTILTVVGCLMVLAAPWLAAAAVRLDRRVAPELLGASRTEALEQRVAGLAESRAGVVDAADAERRRIERDLHDGAQRRLVSLAMNLGVARYELDQLPEVARNVIAEAHEEAKEALTELRTLVRGLHPAILEDRGLDAALSGIAARAPLPVGLQVELPGRAPSAIEAVAYFVVSEALTNIAKHAQASSAEITVGRRGDMLIVTVTDDGIGGADPSRGTGLAGLARRAASVDGVLRVSSPAGGPTSLTVELPCGS